MVTSDQNKGFPFEEEEDDNSGDVGGKTGEVNFRYRDAMSTAPRDDDLSPAEIKHLLAVNESGVLDRVARQRDTIKEREKQKNNPTLHQERGVSLRGGGGGGSASSSPPHPLLSTKPQWTGADPQTTPLPTENKSEANPELKKEYNYRLNPHLVPKSSPPRFIPGG